MQRLIKLESKTITAGGNVQVSLRDLPAGYVIRKIILSAELVITQAVASAAYTETILKGIFNNIELGKRIRGTGRFFDFLYWSMYGRQPDQVAGLVGGAAAAYRRNVRCVIPFADPYALKPIDTCPRTEWFRDTPLVIDFFNPATWDANDSLTSGTLLTYVLCEEVDDNFLPVSTQLGYTDWSGQQPVLEAGLYSHLFQFKDHNTVGTTHGTTNAEISAASVSADSTPLVSLETVQDCALRFNTSRDSGAIRQTLSATAPVVGSLLTSSPIYTGGGAATVTAEMVPLVQPDFGYKITDLVEAKSALSCNFQGTLTTFRLGWRRIEKRSGEAALRGFAKAGNAQAPIDVQAKTDSKQPLSQAARRWFPYLPLKGAKKNAS